MRLHEAYNELDSQTQKSVGEDDAIERTVEGVEPDFVCHACGKKRDMCHQFKFGTLLVHKAITYYEENEPEEVTESGVRHHMRYTYNDHLKFMVWEKTRKYDMTCWLQFPQCLEEGGVQFALKLVHEQQIYHHVTKNRVGGIVKKYMLNIHCAVYDYSSILNDNSFGF